MIKDIIEIIKDLSLRHKGVKTFRYQADILNNAQNNYPYYQVYVDDVSLSQLNITTNIFKIELQMYVLGFPENVSGSTILDIQNNAYSIACDILAKLDNDNEYQGIVSLHDYSILTVSHYSDDDAAGVKLSIELATPNPVDLCDLDENFNEKPYEPEPDKEITIDTDEVGDITINPIKLPKNNRC